MHFWGFRRVIERNGTMEAAAPPHDAAAVPTPSRQAFGRVRSTLFAASQRAFAYEPTAAKQAEERASLLQVLSQLSPTLQDASDWPQWRDGIKKQPNLLVLIAHTDKHLNTPVLEIGDHKQLGKHQIRSDLSGAAGMPQLLILLGCSAAGVTENFQPYPERFRDAGVSIVLAPVAPIRGADAVPIAKHIARLLADQLAKPEPVAFGELLPRLRRELLCDEHPGVMSIVGFGDGDWLLGGP
jgi:hypothetical protein